MAKHHGGREDERGRIDDILAGVLRRRAVHRFKDRHAVAVVCARCKAEATNESGGKITNDVAVEVRCNNHIELRGIFHHLVCNVVDDEVVRLDRRVLRGELFTDALEHPLGKLQDVRLARRRNLLAPLTKCELICETNDLL